MLNYQPKTARLLKIDAVPTLNLPRNPCHGETSERSIRMAKRRHVETINNILMETSHDIVHKKSRYENIEGNENSSVSRENVIRNDEVLIDAIVQTDIQLNT